VIQYIPQKGAIRFSTHKKKEKEGTKKKKEKKKNSASDFFLKLPYTPLTHH
jgi:hypothetical protein